MKRGEIVDVRWSDQRDRRWVRQNVDPATYREIIKWPQWLRRSMSLYRCGGCGQYGALEGIGEDTLMVWVMKQQRCPACQGCNCEQCQAERSSRPVPS